jgi:hypothetical protein
LVLVSPLEKTVIDSWEATSMAGSGIPNPRLIYGAEIQSIHSWLPYTYLYRKALVKRGLKYFAA